jgi:hypothetical protein
MTCSVGWPAKAAHAEMHGELGARRAWQAGVHTVLDQVGGTEMRNGRWADLRQGWRWRDEQGEAG